MAQARAESWQDRDIEELRAREADYRDRLARQATLLERLRGYAEALQRLLRSRPPSRANLPSTLTEVAKLSGQALGTQRTSIWLLDTPQTKLQCAVQLIDNLPVPAATAHAVSLPSTSCPAYIGALTRHNALAVETVYDNPHTLELLPYLRARDIGALLDIPIHLAGELVGVVCHEHVGGPRAWHPEEVSFAANVGSLVALALETERRLTAEYVARNAEARYRHLLESLPATVYSFDLQSGKLAYVSPHGKDLGGIDPDQLIDGGVEGWVSRIHPDDRPAVLARFEPGAHKGYPPELTYRVTLPDGRQRWIRDTCSLLDDASGRGLALQGIVQDVTQQVQSELERRELQRNNRFMVDHSDIHALVLDTDARVLFVNDYMCRTTGYTHEQLIGHNWFEFTAPPSERPRLQAEYSAGLARGWLEPRMEAPLRTASGGKRHVLWTVSLLRRTYGAPRGVSAVGVDLTQRLQLEAELQQQTKIESLGKLAAGVAHDFNNLLQVMLTEAERLGESLSHEPSEPRHPGDPRAAGRRAYRNLRDALAQASDLTHSLLVYGRKETPRKEVVVLDELVQETLNLAASIAGPELSVVATLRSERASVLLERVQLRQVILNIVGNAADAMDRSGGNIQISTHLELIETHVARRHGSAQGGEFAALTVSDDGCGMDERTLSRIFEPFFTTKTRGRGTGLGLALCESIVERAGGFITVDSRQGHGTRVRVYLPTVKNQTEAKVEVATDSDVQPSPLVRAPNDARLLVVDDVPGIRNLLTYRLREVGYHVSEAATVAAAAQILATQPIDVLICDANLPDGSGAVLARSARSVQPELKAILISGTPEEDTGSFDGTLLKPFDAEHFLELVAKALDRRTNRAPDSTPT